MERILRVPQPARVDVVRKALVIGYRVTLDNLESRTVSAARYSVGDDGRLLFTTDGVEVESVEAGRWIEVDQLGSPLVSSWPPPDLDYLMNDLAVLLGVGWGHTGRPAVAADVSSEVFNDEEALLEAAFEAVDAPLDEKKLRAEAVELIRRWFRSNRR